MASLCGAGMATSVVSWREPGKALAPWTGDVAPIHEGCAMAKGVDDEDGEALPRMLAGTLCHNGKGREGEGEEGDDRWDRHVPTVSSSVRGRGEWASGCGHTRATGTGAGPLGTRVLACAWWVAGPAGRRHRSRQRPTGLLCWARFLPLFPI